MIILRTLRHIIIIIIIWQPSGWIESVFPEAWA